MADFIPQKIGEQYHFVSPSASKDFDKIRTLMGRYWEIGSAFQFKYLIPTPPIEVTKVVNFQVMRPVLRTLALKRIQFSTIPAFRKSARAQFDALSHTEVFAAQNAPPLGPAFPNQAPKYRTRFLNLPNFPSEYFIFQPETKNWRGGQPIVYTGEEVAGVVQNIQKLRKLREESMVTRQKERTAQRARAGEIRSRRERDRSFVYTPMAVTSEETQAIDKLLAEEARVLRWVRGASGRNDGSQYEVHNLFLNSREIGERQITEIHESKVAGSAEQEFDDPWKPTKAFEVPLYKIVANMTSQLIDAEIENGHSYEDYVFNFSRPLKQSIIEKMNTGGSRIRYGVAETSCQYSYYLENYEKELEAPVVSERSIPNVYGVNMLQSFIDKGALVNASEWVRIYDPILYSIVSCQGKIPREKIKFKVAKNDTDAIKGHRKIGKVRKTRATPNSNSSYMEYLSLWRKNQNFANEVTVELANDKNRNIIFGAKDYNFLQEISSKTENIPMCAKIEFAVESNQESHNSIVEMFRKANCLSLLMVKAMEHSRPKEGNEAINPDAASVWDAQQFNYFPQVIRSTPAGEPSDWQTTDMKQVQVPSFDLKLFLERILNSGVDMTLDELSEHYYTLIHDGHEMNPFVHDEYRASTHRKMQLNAFLMNGMLQGLVEKKRRTFSEIMHGKMADTEVVFYEIEKIRIGNNGTRSTVQRFWVPNFKGRETIELIDSQVKYGSVYQYQVHAWTAIYGNRYQYDGASAFKGKRLRTTGIRNFILGRFFRDLNISHKTSSDGWRLGIINKPTVRLARLPYQEFEPLRVADHPPIPPNVDLVPFRAVNNKIKINFNAAIDDHITRPIVLGPSDYSNIIKTYQTQYGVEDATILSERLWASGEAEMPIRFRSDDLPKYFQVYRIDFEPTSWTDFEGRVIASLDAEEDITSMIDDVSPNVDYYYTFRSVDIHGNISNPSNVLHVKLVDDQGIFPIIEPHDFKATQQLSRGFMKPVRRFLQITPVFEQIVYKDERQEEEQTTIANRRNILLGSAQDSIYGKRLKIRITSKKSGRKIDLNVSFTHKHLKPPN